MAFSRLFGNLHGLIWVENNSKQPESTCFCNPSSLGETWGEIIFGALFDPHVTAKLNAVKEGGT